MIRRAIPLLGLALTCLLLPSFASTARADATIISSTVENAYPKQLVFRVTAQSAANITDVTLNYELVGTGASSIGKPSPELTSAKTLTAEVVLQVNSASAFIPVGTEFVYHWEIASADGTTTTGPEQRYFYLPPGQDWQTAKSDLVMVYYHGNQQAAAGAFVKAVAETYDRIGKNLLQTSLKQLPVKAIYFSTEKEMGEAAPGRGTRFDEAVTNCGLRPSNSGDIIFLNPAKCGTDATDTLRHEFTHILTKSAGESALGKLPSWLDEGTAVYGQTEPGQSYIGPFQAAARANRLIPFNQMGSPSNDPSLVGLFYGQSYMMTKYLIDKGGPATFAKLFATIKGGTRFDDAIKQVYGFDVAQFEDDFRTANRAGPAQPAATPTPRPQPRSQPTAVPTAQPAAQETDSDGGGSGDSELNKPMLFTVGLAVLFALLGIFAYLVAQLMANNRARTSAPRPPDDWRRPGDGPGS